MLRITISSDELSICFRLEGKLVGPWAKELRRTWDSVQARRRGAPANADFAFAGADERSCLLDLSAVNYVDDAGREVLAHCFAEGAQLKAAGPLTSYIVETIVREQSPTVAKPPTPRSKKAAAAGEHGCGKGKN